jgi:hypothetical protein
MNNRWLPGLLFLGLLLLGACGDQRVPQQDAVREATATPEQNGMSTPSPGTVSATTSALSAQASDTATVTGHVVSSQTGEPLSNTTVRLAQVYWNEGEAAFVIDGARSPGAITDESGVFVVPDITAQEYVLVIGNLETGDYVIIPDERDSNKARVWNAEEGEVLDMGEIVVELN